ncbi:MAG: tetraprenyl-beta-curcumene synthase family protein [Limnochordia bacterium]|jgi:tetraprenyl-beta-curcumene synthase|nr:tetraprenyl-beta-curcumene synthase family protein [Limnochordia bacterium]MDD4517720.1 tetraprenyl-beta-curcumene synthase family protein [Limnochordia bacterium]
MQQTQPILPTPYYLNRYIHVIMPRVRDELRSWLQELCYCPDAELAQQAKESIALKEFHCLGGGAYILGLQAQEEPLLRAIVSLQTISDYLDNLCDRVGFEDEQAFRNLHQAMLNAVGESSIDSDYYRGYPHQDDGGYLERLAQTCLSASRQLPGFFSVQPEIKVLIQRYIDLQVYKHLPCGREGALTSWFADYRSRFPNLFWWEFAAACGSTLAVFALLRAATLGPVDEQSKGAILRCYFPWVCGLHILLDYFIDLEEDRQHRDLNLVSYYGSLDLLTGRLIWFLRNSIDASSRLPEAQFHLLIVRGLLAMYLSDPKVDDQGFASVREALLTSGGMNSRLMYRVCRLLRVGHVL